MNNYNWISTYYDKCAKLVFGHSQINAQREQLKFVSSNSTVLIVGGGTGLILSDIANLKLSGIIVDFVEPSAGMIKIAKGRSHENVQVNYINLPLENFEMQKKYDAVLTAFFFDNFEKEEGLINFKIIYRQLKNNGFWLFCDFSLATKEGWIWKSSLIKVMYLFFRVVAKVRTLGLVDMQPTFEAASLCVQQEKWYYNKFIRASVYQKVI